MGKTTRWLKSVLGMKKEKEKTPIQHSVLYDKNDKKTWSFAKSGKDVDANSQTPSAVTDAAWLRSYFAETEKVQNKHAVAVAAATAAAADAAMAAAQAAVAVVRLTSNARASFLAGGKEKWPAVKIQAAFRGYLSRKALRALKGLVRLQALVRGYLVRKRAAATLHSMQALIRAQSAVRSQRMRRSFNKENRYHPENQPRKSIERFDEWRSEINAYDDNPKIIEIDTLKSRSRSHRFNTALSECGDDLPYQTISSPLPRRSNAPTTPTQSVCGDGYFKPYSNFPNYMTNTQSFKAKLRSYSAPKQRPESGGAKKRLSHNEIMAARNSISGVRMNKSYYQIHHQF
ncbi:hypothetical protein V6Z11_A02G140700 [Gossypium hirsutum]